MEGEVDGGGFRRDCWKNEVKAPPGLALLGAFALLFGREVVEGVGRSGERGCLEKNECAMVPDELGS